jgi:hypothetical protein
VCQPLPRVNVIGILGLVIGGSPIFSEAIESLRARRMTMELSIRVGRAGLADVYLPTPQLSTDECRPLRMKLCAAHLKRQRWSLEQADS